MDWNKLKAELVAALTVVFMVLNSKLHWGIDATGVAAIVGLVGSLIVMYAMSHTAQVKADSAIETKATPEGGGAAPATTAAPGGGPAGTAKFLGIVLVLGLLLGGSAGCSGLAAKTAKDLSTAGEQILPEYLAYVDADAKLDAGAKQRRKDQVQAFRDVLKNAQK